MYRVCVGACNHRKKRPFNIGETTPMKLAYAREAMCLVEWDKDPDAGKQCAKQSRRRPATTSRSKPKQRIISLHAKLAPSLAKSHGARYLR